MMAGGDVDELFRKFPGHYQQTSGAAMINSEGLPLTLEHVTSGGRCHSIDEIGVDSGIDICQRHPSYVMQDSRCISEVAVDRVPARNPLRHHRRRDTMAPACMQR